MKTFILTFLVAWACFAQTFAQAPQGKISGQVLDHTKQPAIAATVTLVTAGDSVSVKTTLADANGRFTLDKLSSGEFKLWITVVGSQKYRSDVIKVAGGSVTIPVIQLKQGGTTLKEVAVTAQKDFIEQKVDRTVVNVASSISNTGANALEVLEKAPGVTVDANGTITFKGKTGVMVMIDDKPTYLSGDGLANYLRSLPASALDKIELMANPPAKYDASGNAGMINIKTKRSKVKGFNGSFSASTGKAQYWRTNESLNLNYVDGKLNMFAIGGYNLNNNHRRLDVGRHYFDAAGTPTSNYTEVGFFHNLNGTPSLKIGADYALNAKDNIGLILTGGLTRGNLDNTMNSAMTRGNGQLDSTILAFNTTKSTFNNGGINLNYGHKFDSLGKAITVDLDYLNYYTRRDQVFLNSSYNAAGTLAANQHIIDDQPGYLNIYSAKTDLTLPLKNKGKLSTGLKASYVDIDNGANYYNVFNGNTTVDYNMTNRFLYNENVNAAYLNFDREFKRFSVQVGLRAENTNLRGHQLGNARSPDSSFAQHYTSLFPTAFVLYKLDSAGRNSLNFSYGRRIDRPYYQDLNPFVVILDKYSHFTGNPFLRPQYVSIFQLNYSYRGKITAGLEYSNINNYQTEYDFQQGDVFVATSVNLGRRQHKSLFASANVDVFKWWNSYNYAELNVNDFIGPLGNVYVDFTSTYFYYNTNNQFTLGNGWGAELSGYYMSPYTDSQFTHVYRGQVNVGLQKKLFSNKLIVKVGARDIFRNNFSGGNIRNIPNVQATYFNDFANRVVTMGFTYNFGTSFKSSNKRQNSIDELNRVRN